MKSIINLTYKSVADKMFSDRVLSKSCFELFGYDFMIDENKKVWLIEVNTNPCIEESSQLLKGLIP
jgi:D-alanine-D-alanine ligase-like ATP-grasp enzyme